MEKTGRAQGRARAGPGPGPGPRGQLRGDARGTNLMRSRELGYNTVRTPTAEDCLGNNKIHEDTLKYVKMQ